MGLFHFGAFFRWSLQQLFIKDTREGRLLIKHDKESPGVLVIDANPEPHVCVFTAIKPVCQMPMLEKMAEVQPF
jgi:hypothetical protein